MEDKFIACSKCGGYPNIKVAHRRFSVSCPVCKYRVRFEISKTHNFDFNDGIDELIYQWNIHAKNAKFYGGNTDGK